METLLPKESQLNLPGKDPGLGTTSLIGQLLHTSGARAAHRAGMAQHQGLGERWPERCTRSILLLLHQRTTGHSPGKQISAGSHRDTAVQVAAAPGRLPAICTPKQHPLQIAASLQTANKQLAACVRLIAFLRRCAGTALSFLRQSCVWSSAAGTETTPKNNHHHKACREGRKILWDSKGVCLHGLPRNNKAEVLSISAQHSAEMCPSERDRSLGCPPAGQKEGSIPTTTTSASWAQDHPGTPPTRRDNPRAELTQSRMDVAGFGILSYP